MHHSKQKLTFLYVIHSLGLLLLFLLVVFRYTRILVNIFVILAFIVKEIKLHFFLLLFIYSMLTQRGLIQLNITE